MVVAGHLEPHIVRGWIDALAKGRPLTEEPNLGFEAVVDKKTNTVTIKVKMDYMKAPVTYVARSWQPDQPLCKGDAGGGPDTACP